MIPESFTSKEMKGNYSLHGADKAGSSDPSFKLLN